jgi:hypothetical protein
LNLASTVSGRSEGCPDPLASLPTVAVTSLIAFNVIPVSVATVIAGAALLLVLVGLGLRITSAAFDRERLITGTR